MRILLDENMPYDFGEGHEVRTVKDMQWLGKKNGELLGLAAFKSVSGCRCHLAVLRANPIKNVPDNSMANLKKKKFIRAVLSLFQSILNLTLRK